MQAKVLSNSILKSFQGSDGNVVSYSDTPILLSGSDGSDDLILILRSSAKNSFHQDDIISFDPYIPKKQGSILKATNIKISKSSGSGGVSDV